MKKIMNRPETMVMEMCNGMILANPKIQLLPKYKVLKKKELNVDKVTLISGGGSGHEPAHGGYIGTGMLDAAVCGDMFASPSQVQVYQAIRQTAGKKGTLLIIKNYSGDMMNFKNAAHLAREDGIIVDYIKVDDDIAVEDSLYTVGNRGVAGTVFVHKIAGAAAEQELELQEVKRIAAKAAENVKSIGFALTSCIVPSKGTPTFSLNENEIEYGVGIHGEPGIRREPLVSANELAGRMVQAILDKQPVNSEDEIALMVNGFGGTPLQELYLLHYEVQKYLNEKNVHVYRTFVGNFMTSIDMAGASISILKLDTELKKYLDMPSDAPGFPVYGKTEKISFVDMVSGNDESTDGNYEVETAEECSRINDNQISLDNMIYIVDVMSHCIIQNEVPFCELDSHAGDGDFGLSVSKGFRQLKREWAEIIEQSNGIGDFLNACALVIMEYCGGASGPIWGSAFRSAAKAVGNKLLITPSEFADMMMAAVKGVQQTGERSFGRGAVVGDKTLIDALEPCAETLVETAAQDISIQEMLRRGANAAVEGAKATEAITAKMGRAGTVGERSLGFPDAGAYALGIIFTEIAEVIK